MAFGAEIKRLRTKNKISAQSLSNMLGISAVRLRKWEERDTNPRYEEAKIIEEYFGIKIGDFKNLDSLPNVQKVTRETGKIPDSTHQEKLLAIKNGEKRIPAYSGNTQAGIITVYSDDPSMQEPVGSLPASMFPGCNHAEKINGDSMYPLIVNQGWCIGKIIDKRGIIWGEKYIIHTKYGQNIVKYVQKSDKGEDHIKIVSHNKKIPDQDIPLDDITFCVRVYFIINPL